MVISAVPGHTEAGLGHGWRAASPRRERTVQPEGRARLPGFFRSLRHPADVCRAEACAHGAAGTSEADHDLWGVDILGVCVATDRSAQCPARRRHVPASRIW